MDTYEFKYLVNEDGLYAINQLMGTIMFINAADIHTSVAGGVSLMCDEEHYIVTLDFYTNVKTELDNLFKAITKLNPSIDIYKCKD